MSKQDVLELLGIEDENVKEMEDIITDVLAKANELGKNRKVDFAFKQDIEENRVTPTSEIIAELHEVVFWYSE